MTDRACRWVTVQVGRHGRSVNEVATDLGCDWHTVMDAVAVYGQVRNPQSPMSSGTVRKWRPVLSVSEAVVPQATPVECAEVQGTTAV